MTKTRREHLELASTLLARERDATDADERAAATRLLEKLFFELTPLIGAGGVTALFARTVVIAKMDCRSIEALPSSADSLDAVRSRLREHFANVAREEVAACATALCATFLSLMSRFVGEPLTMRLVHRAWPDEREEPS